MNEPSVTSLIERFVSGGWEQLSQLGSNPEQSKDKSLNTVTDYERVSAAAARLYGTHDFQVILEWLLDLTLRKASWHAALGCDPAQAASYGVLREGQNSVVALLIGAIVKGQSGDDVVRKQDI